VLKIITFLTLFLIAASIVFSVPIIFVLIASNGKNSQVGTCLSAAA
jgi:Sec-independent protein secretion pathway component TatC